MSMQLVEEEYFTAFEVKKSGNAMHLTVHPEYADMFPVEMLQRVITCTLTAAAQEIEHEAGDFSFTHSPFYDFYLHVSVTGEGLVKIDASGATMLTPAEAAEYLYKVAADYS